MSPHPSPQIELFVSSTVCMYVWCEHETEAEAKAEHEAGALEGYRMFYVRVSMGNLGIWEDYEEFI